MEASSFRLALTSALLLSCGTSERPSSDASFPSDDASAEDAAAPDAEDAGDTPLADAGPGDACSGACIADDAGRAAAPSDASAPSSADADVPLVFTPSYGPCPAPLHCDALMAFIAQPLIVKAYPSAPAGVSACVEPDVGPVPAVPACYEDGPCQIGNEVGICLGREPPHPKTGYCLKPCL